MIGRTNTENSCSICEISLAVEEDSMTEGFVILHSSVIAWYIDVMLLLLKCWRS